MANSRRLSRLFPTSNYSIRNAVHSLSCRLWALYCDMVKKVTGNALAQIWCGQGRDRLEGRESIVNRGFDSGVAKNLMMSATDGRRICYAWRSRRGRQLRHAQWNTSVVYWETKSLRQTSSTQNSSAGRNGLRVRKASPCAIFNDRHGLGTFRNFRNSEVF